jgi:shikimate dehydrogenase
VQRAIFLQPFGWTASMIKPIEGPTSVIRSAPLRSWRDEPMDEVSYISGETRLFAIVGHPIQQVRSPEMVTAELTRRGHNAILVPLDVRPEEFESCVGQFMRVRNLDGLIFTIPFKQAACALAGELGAQARVVGAINAMARGDGDKWVGDIFDGLGCVEAFRRRQQSFRDRRVMLIGAGGAGAAIGVAVAHQGPAAIRIFDPDEVRATRLVEAIGKIDPRIDVCFAEPTIERIDMLLNASPVGMLGDDRMPIEVAKIPAEIIVFDAIVKPEFTKFLTFAQQCGCRTILGREMMRGQIGKIVDFFEAQRVRATLVG